MCKLAAKRLVFRVCPESKETEFFGVNRRSKGQNLRVVGVVGVVSKRGGVHFALRPCTARIACEADTSLKVTLGFQNPEKC